MSRIHQRSDKQHKQGQNKPSNRPGKHGQQNGQQANSKMRSGGRRNGRGGKSIDKNRGKSFHREENKSHNKAYNLVGVISTTQKGAGYIDLPDKKKESIYLEPGDLNTALNGDTVEVSVTKKMVRGVMSEVGQVLRVISRAREFFVGTVFVEGGKFMVMPDDRKMYLPIVISKEPTRDFSTTHEFRENDKVYVKLKPWLNPSVNPSGEVVRILGQKGVNDVEMESIVLEQGFEIGFPHAVEKEADVIRINKAITGEEISKRRDVRGTLTFTIDPFDAKDFDDAISFKVLPADSTIQNVQPMKGGALYEIGVHIADVSHYVRLGTALDREAIKRGCSIYLVDRTIPMLPEVLSNDVCSLKPHEDKLTFSAIFTVDENARIHSRWFGKTLINSDHRYTYESAQTVIDGKANLQDQDGAEGNKYAEELRTLNRLAKILRKRNASAGAIEFSSDEVKIMLDEKGKPVKIIPKKALDTHKLVEEFMLLANREVAKYIYDSIKKKGKKDTGAIYRIHDVPDKDRIRDLQSFVKLLGYDLRGQNGEVTAHDINHLLDQVEDTPHESLIRTATIRSMQKAIYSTKNVGHFGLAFEFYTHFTSPIRRYPDLLVQRILEKHLKDQPFADTDIAALQKLAESSTDREINAAKAERESKKLKQIEYMSERIGQIFQGTISGVARWGVYVEDSATKCEAIIPIANLGEDYFIFQEKSYSIVGEKSKRRFTLGDAVKFKVKSVDMERRSVEAALVE